MRKTANVRITDADSRDNGKVYKITEMPATQAEKWGARALLALSRAGVDVPDDVAKSGLQGIAILGLKALGGVSFEDAELLMDEMFGCVTIVPDEAKNPDYSRTLVETDIEEVATRVLLRGEVFKLHTGFSLADGGSSSTSPPPASPAS